LCCRRSRRSKNPTDNKENAAKEDQNMAVCSTWSSRAPAAVGGGRQWHASHGNADQRYSLEHDPRSICDGVDMNLLHTLVTLPPHMDANEWRAAQGELTHLFALQPFIALGFFANVNTLYGALSEFCTANSCPVMCVPGQK
jgi:hypothetical protein